MNLRSVSSNSSSADCEGHLETPCLYPIERERTARGKIVIGLFPTETLVHGDSSKFQRPICAINSFHRPAVRFRGFTDKANLPVLYDPGQWNILRLRLTQRSREHSCEQAALLMFARVG